MILEVSIRAPVLTPVSMNQDGFSLYLFLFKEFLSDLFPMSIVGFNEHTREIGTAFKGKFTQVVAIFIPVKGTVEICACIRDHFDTSDLEFRAGCIKLPRLLPTEVVTYQRGRQPLVRDHARLDCMT